MRQDARKRLINCFLTAMLSVALVVTMIPAAAIPVFAEGETTPDTETFNIAILSDIHYVSNALQPAEGDSEAKAAFEKAELTENRMMSEIDTILDQALRDAAGTDPDAMLVCGDLCSNGEFQNEQGLADKLTVAEGTYGTDIYVINGNHDINMSYGADFSGNAVANTKRTQASDFKAVYNGLGYGENVRYYDATPGSEVKNYGGLSYATEIRDGITLIALDTAQYSGDETQRFGDAQKTAGAVSDGLLAWAEEQAEEAKAKGNLVLAMCHHSLIPHQGVKNPTSDLFFSEYLVPDWEKVAGTLADAGVSAILTGHSHANDISKYQTETGNTIYDIQTAALCAYPCSWRDLQITIDRSGEEPVYSFEVKSHFMERAEGLDLTFQGKTYNDLQEYSYFKTGIPEESLTYLAEFLLREQLYAVRIHDGGFQGFLQEKLEIPDGKSTGKYATEEISKLIDTAEPIEEKFTLLGSDYTLRISPNKESTELRKVFNVSLSYETNETVDKVTIPETLIPEDLREKLDELAQQEDSYVEITKDDGSWTIKMLEGFPEATKAQLLALAGISTDGEKTETGKLFIDLSGFERGINNAIEAADADINEEGKWENNYQRTTIEKEASKVITKNVCPVLTEPIDKEDPQTAPIFMARDALQAFNRGDEASFVPEFVYGDITAEELTAKRQHWNELILGKDFESKIEKSILETVYAVGDEDEYPMISALLDTSLAPDPTDEDSCVFSYEVDDDATTLPLLGSLISQVKSLRYASAVLNTLYGFGVDPLSGLDLSSLTKMFAELQETMTTDLNVETDSELSFVADWHPIDRSKQMGEDGTAFGKGAAIEAAEAAIAGMTSDKDPKGTKIAPMLVKSSGQTNSSVKLTWKKASGAQKYVVYGSLCGGKNKMKKLTETAGTSFNAAKLKKGKYNKFMVVAIDAENNVVVSSKIVHVATSGSKKAANPKKVVVKAKVSKTGKKLKKYKATSKITLRAGSTPKKLVKSTALRTSFTKAKKTKVIKHVGMRYESSNAAVAAVSAKGKVTAKKKGSCRIYVYAQNGAVKVVTVKVK